MRHAAYQRILLGELSCNRGEIANFFQYQNTLWNLLRLPSEHPDEGSCDGFIQSARSPGTEGFRQGGFAYEVFKALKSQAIVFAVTCG